jgi:hypothetical protein
VKDACRQQKALAAIPSLLTSQAESRLAFSGRYNFILRPTDPVTAGLLPCSMQQVLSVNSSREPEIILHVGLPTSERLACVNEQSLAFGSAKVNGGGEAGQPAPYDDRFHAIFGATCADNITPS